MTEDRRVGEALDTALHEGQQARLRGEPALNNPYFRVSDHVILIRAWDRGWLEEDKALRTGE